MSAQKYKAIKRLGKSHAEFEKSSYAAGRYAGNDWAKKRATFEELLKMKIRIGDDHLAFARNADRNHEEPYGWLAVCLGGPSYEGCGNMFWFDLLESEDQGIKDEEFVFGFIDGSLSFFDRHYQKIVNSAA